MKKLFFIASVLFLASCGDKGESNTHNEPKHNAETPAAENTSTATTPASGTTSTPEATGRYKAGDNLNVLAISGLTLRDKPDIKGAKVAAVSYGASVSVLPDDLFKKPYQSTEMKGFEIKGNWVKVSTGGKEGYLFDGFLSKIPAPKEEDYSVYLGKVAKMTKCDKKKPKGEENLFAYESCTYENGMSLLSKGYEGGASTKIFIPSSVASFEEAYLITKALEGKTNPTNLCKYDAAKGEIECTEKGGMLFTTISKQDKGTEIEFSVAD